MKNKALITILLICLLFGKASVVCLYAQSFSQDVIGSAGTYATSPNGSMAWTIGEIVIESFSIGDNSFTQGFHQPDERRVVEPIDFFIPEGFSPNGDLINDLFVIRGILRYPNNTFVIFNRWGNKLFEASPYQNKWGGKSMFGLRVEGYDLPGGTYFYILDLNDGSKVYKGTIYLNR